VQKEINLVLTPEEAANNETIKAAAAKEARLEPSVIDRFRIIRKSIDARSRLQIKVNLAVIVYVGENPKDTKNVKRNYPDVHNKPEVCIAGFGPAGIFAALRVMELGFKPVIFERGKQVSERKRDIAQICRNNSLNPESNYCFGEGGAGTFSDGKLYTRSKKRGDNENILQTFFEMGAPEDILYDAHPHIGTDKLPAVIVQIRKTILEHGGEIHFNTKITNIFTAQNRISGLELNHSGQYACNNLILATGHSARDIYELLHGNNILLQAKGFAMGVRVEHPQEMIDFMQYHQEDRGDFLPAASYNLNTQVEGRGVYSFCMCPGGFIVPASTSAEEIVVNGMSPAKRNSPFANSGIVVEIQPEDITEYNEYGPLKGLKYQQSLESMTFHNGGIGMTAPAQRLDDFVHNKLSPFLPGTSYFPGVISSPLHFWLPDLINNRLKAAFKQFGKTMKDFLTNEAIVVGVESRTSSTIRIPRDSESLQHPEINGLYPCGEGSGYSGGIVSSAIDGERCAEKAVAYLS
jgi:uncharacterized protein